MAGIFGGKYVDEYPLKHIRLEQLYNSGFNVADYICWPPGKLDPEQLKVFLEKHGRISCRHFHADEKKHFKCPVLYDQTDFNTVLDFCSEHNKTYYTLCNEAIVLGDSVCAGNILVHNESTYFVEFFYGSGTPRDIESKAPPELKVYSKSGYSPAEGDRPPDEVLGLTLRARQFRALANKAYIIEFSVYPYPVGKNQSKVICWEWRWGWLHYQLEANKRLLEENKKLHDLVSELKRENENLKGRTAILRNEPDRIRYIQ